MFIATAHIFHITLSVGAMELTSKSCTYFAIDGSAVKVRNTIDCSTVSNLLVAREMQGTIRGRMVLRGAWPIYVDLDYIL
jgi:hypothetical protein